MGKKLPIVKHKTLIEEGFFKRLMIAICAVTFSALIIFILVYASDLFLIFFAAILVSIWLFGMGSWVKDHTRFSIQRSIGIVLLILTLAFSLVISSAMPTISNQIDELTEALPSSLEKTQSFFMQNKFVQKAATWVKSAQLLPTDSRVLLGKSASITTSILGFLGSVLFILILGIYMSLSPHEYLESALKLVPTKKKERVRYILYQVEHKLRWWLIGKFVGMFVIGFLTTIGLLILKVPLALVLGIIAGILNFIPNIGPMLALIPGLLIGFAESPHKAVYIFMLYTGIQIFETYLVTPYIEQRTVLLPPALIIFSQILLGLLLGFFGLALATPLVATMVVLLKHFYIEDVLGNHSSDPLTD